VREDEGAVALASVVRPRLLPEPDDVDPGARFAVVPAAVAPRRRAGRAAFASPVAAEALSVPAVPLFRGLPARPDRARAPAPAPFFAFVRRRRRVAPVAGVSFVSGASERGAAMSAPVRGLVRDSASTWARVASAAAERVGVSASSAFGARCSAMDTPPDRWCAQFARAPARSAAIIGGDRRGRSARPSPETVLRQPVGGYYERSAHAACQCCSERRAGPTRASFWAGAVRGTLLAPLHLQKMS
jgi:hypothetical protein